MKNIRYILFLSIFFLLSCSQDKLDEIDTDPNNPVYVPSEFVIPSAEIKMLQNFFESGSATAISTYVEHTCNVHPEKMELNRKTGIWNDGYSILKDTKRIIDQSSKEEAWTHVGIAQVVQAFTLGTMTEIFGDIPWTEALQGSNNRNPKYDTQESVYNALFQMLDDAIANLSKTALTNPGKNDILLAGSKDKWIKVAWGLKARYKNRLSNINPTGSASDALAAVNNSFTSSADNFIFTNYQNASTYCNAISMEENSMKRFAASITILKVIDSFNDPGFSDPRAERWFNKIGGKFIGAPNGNDDSDIGHTIFSGISTTNVLNLNAPMPLLTYDELKFIEAEANFRLGRLPEANSAYQKAVNAACVRAGLTAGQITSYTSQGKVFTSDSNLTLDMIIKQKFLSFFMMQPIEAFNDYRRTLIPSLYNTKDGIPCRIIYPDAEIAQNINAPENINLVTAFTIKLWWAK